MPAKKITMRCATCGEVKAVENFGWSKKRRAPTKSCKRCWVDPSKNRAMIGNETAEELVLYYARIRELMVDIGKAQADQVKEGLPVDRKIESHGDIWLSEMSEEAYRAIIQALKRKAEQGDTRAAELLLKERNARAGDPTPASVQDSWEDLFKVDPLATGKDSE